MPILRQFIDGAELFDRATEQPVDGSRDEFFRHGALNSVHFNTQVAADLFCREERDRYALNDFGQITCPYPEMFMEWEIPTGTTNDLIDVSVAALITSHSDVIFVDPLVLGLDGTVYSGTTSMRVFIDPSGMPLRRQILGPKEHMGKLAEVEWLTITRDVAHVAMLALGLINCKNVTTREVGHIAWKRSGREKRRGAAPNRVRYNTIILPGGGSVVEGKPNEVRHRASALHRVRGHFKTYTADAPLLGKHVGTYWWGWQVRGDLDNGAVVSNYRLATS